MGTPRGGWLILYLAGGKVSSFWIFEGVDFSLTLALGRRSTGKAVSRAPSRAPLTPVCVPACALHADRRTRTGRLTLSPQGRGNLGGVAPPALLFLSPPGRGLR